MEPAMPAANPRITITLKPSVHALLRRLSELTGNSQSSMVGELLEQSAPVFERMVRVMEAAAEAHDMAKQEMAGGLERAQAKLEKQLGLALETMDEGFRPILEEAEKVKRRAAGAGGPRLRGAPRRSAAAGGLTPVPLTGGSGGHGLATKGGRKGGKRGGV